MADNPANYVKENAVYIFGDITNATISDMAGNLRTLVDSLTPSQNNDKSKIQNPYDAAIDTPVVDVFINSYGGELRAYQTIAGLLGMAKMKGAIVRTNIFGSAGSCASVLAVQGTPGYRIMQEHSEHFVHYGRSTININKDTEPDKRNKYHKVIRAQFLQPYLDRTKITPERLAKLTEDEAGYLSSKQCLRLGFCDWILYNDGTIKGR